MIIGGLQARRSEKARVRRSLRREISRASVAEEKATRAQGLELTIKMDSGKHYQSFGSRCINQF